MKVLKYHRVVMIFLGIYPRPPNLSSGLSWLHFSPFYTIICMIVSAILSALYVYQGQNTARLSYVFEAFALVLGSSGAFGASLNMKLNMNQIGVVQSKLQAIADQGDS